MKGVAIIPARGGSKRIPGKNIRLFNGRPMIAWSIQAALQTECISNVLVSTDDPQIAEIARRYGASVPFVRPSELSDDLTATLPVVQHAVQWALKNMSDVPGYFCCLYATAPFVQSEAIQQAFNTIISGNYDYVFAATSFAAPIQRAFSIDKSGAIQMFQPEHFHTRSQDLQPAYHDAGQFYWGTTNAWLTKKQIFSESSTAIVLPRFQVQDIDNEEDWIMAEYLMRAQHINNLNQDEK